MVANNGCQDTLPGLVSVISGEVDSVKTDIVDIDKQKTTYIETSSSSAAVDIWKYVDEVFHSYVYPIITLIIGALITWTVSSIQNNRHSRKMGKRWLAELSAIYADIEKQMESFNAFINEYCNDKDRFDIPDITYGFINSRNIESFGKENLYDYLDKTLKQNVDDIYHKITNVISSLDVIDSQCKNNIAQFKDKSSALVTAYNESYNNYINLLRALPRDAPGIPEDKLRLLKVYNWEIVSGTPRINIFEIEEKNIKPSLDILLHYPFPPEIIASLQNCANITSALRNEKIYIKGNLESANKRYESALKIILEVKETIKHNKRIHLRKLRSIINKRSNS